MTQSEQAQGLEPEEQLEAGLGDLTPEGVEALDDQVAAEKGKPEEAAFEDEDQPLDEDAVLAEVDDEDEEGVA
jgi:hypothetical protein